MEEEVTLSQAIKKSISGETATTKQPMEVKELLDGKCWLLYDVLSVNECQALIKAATDIGFDAKYSGER